jgi:hypothetical protein
VLDRCETGVASWDDLVELFLNEICLLLVNGIGVISNNEDEHDVFDEIEHSIVPTDSLRCYHLNAYFDIHFYDWFWV